VTSCAHRYQRWLAQLCERRFWGGVSQWSEASSPYLDAADGQTLQVWYGVVTTAGPSQVDVTWTGAVQNVDLGLQELNAGTDPTWSLDDVGFSNEPFPL